MSLTYGVAATLWTPGSILDPSSLDNRFRALKPFERELHFKESYVIFGNPDWATP